MKILLIIMLFSCYLKSEWKEALFNPDFFTVSLNCPDSNNCYELAQSNKVGGNSETLIRKSTDQGKSWFEIYLYDPFKDNPKFLLSPEYASVPSGKDYFISYFENGSLKVSNDSAKTFRTIELGTSREVLWIDMYDENVGMAFTPINNYITYDGWKTWEERDDFYKVSDPENNVYSPKEPEFQSKDILYLLTAKTTNKSGGSCLTIFDMQTKNTSFHFIDTLEHDGYYPFIRDFSVIDLNTIIAVGQVSSTFGQTSYNLIYKSTDAGKTWVKKHQILEGLPIGYAGGLQKVAFYDKNNGVAVGARGSILLTNDGGETWKYEDIPKSMEDSPTMKVEWAGRTPIIGTYKGGLYYYEGDYFKFDQVSQYKITGQVTTEKGEPVAGVEIEFATPIKPEEGVSVFTDSEGYYEINDIPDSAYGYLRIRSFVDFEKTYRPITLTLIITNDTVINFTEYSPEAYHSLAGKVTEDGEGIKRLPVNLHTSYGDKIIYTDDEGNYRIEKVPEGDINVLNGSADDLGYQFYKPSGYGFMLQNDTTGIDFEVVDRDKGFMKRISGRVTKGGEGMPNFHITILSSASTGKLEETLTDENGYYYSNFVLDGGSPAEVDVSFDDFDYTKYELIPFRHYVKFYEYEGDIENIDFILSPITSVAKGEQPYYIYPNPASEYVTISGIENGKAIIYNSIGQKLIEQDITSTSEINISNLQSGMYIVKLENAGKVTFEKLMVGR